MQIFILFTMVSLSLFGCVIQPLPVQASTTDTSVTTPTIIYTASPTFEETEVLPTIFPSSTPEATEVPLTVTLPPIPNGVFYFGSTPIGSQVGGISGVFYRQHVMDEMCPWIYHILRFYEDGLVMDVPVCEDAAEDVARYFVDNVWPDTSKWFNHENDDPTLSRGIYNIAENQVWFTTTAENETVVSDYFGTFSEDRLILNSYSHSTGHQTTDEEFIFLDIPSSP